jgi:hypothetical protein
MPRTGSRSAIRAGRVSGPPGQQQQMPVEAGDRRGGRGGHQPGDRPGQQRQGPVDVALEAGRGGVDRRDEQVEDGLACPLGQAPGADGEREQMPEVVPGVGGQSSQRDHDALAHPVTAGVEAVGHRVEPRGRRLGRHPGVGHRALEQLGRRRDLAAGPGRPPGRQPRLGHVDRQAPERGPHQLDGGPVHRLVVAQAQGDGPRRDRVPAGGHGDDHPLRHGGDVERRPQCLEVGGPQVVRHHALAHPVHERDPGQEAVVVEGPLDHGLDLVERRRAEQAQRQQRTAVGGLQGADDLLPQVLVD